MAEIAEHPADAVSNPGPLVTLDHWFARELPGLCEPWQAATALAPRLLVLNDELAEELGLDVNRLRTAEGISMLVGNQVPPGATPVAQAYAGHQFGGLSPRLGDGRALLLGELTDVLGHRRDLHLKGSGRTPFARGGDGKAAVGPMLREHLIGEAMHALGIPTTRALAVTATGEQVARDTMLPGAVLTRVAASHLRVGMFQYAAMSDDPTLVRRLADHAIARHHPAAADAANRYLALFEGVLAAQAALIAKWMNVGFIHGVMNTDNMTISGETIDFGPCGFMEAYDLATVFSSIDHGGRYAYGNQPPIAQWNLARLAEALLPLFDDCSEAAVEVATELIRTFPDRYRVEWLRGMRRKLGLIDERPEDEALIDDLLTVMYEHRVDMTSCFRALSSNIRGDGSAAKLLFSDASGLVAFAEWSTRHLTRVAAADASLGDVAAAMDAINPVYIPRNHLVEAALTAASGGDLGPYELLLAAVKEPFVERTGREKYAEPAPSDFGLYRTFCGT